MRTQTPSLVYREKVSHSPNRLTSGLNVEQRKRLTIGVELVAKPELLLFLDEPTSGLDSQTSWSILMLLRKLTEHGQAILCTIHQPSAILFEQFDRLLFLAKGGKTVYYGEVGHQSHVLVDYFTRNGAPPCKAGNNPAEWMLAAIGAAPGSHTDVDWHQTWLDSPERAEVRQELERIKLERPEKAIAEKARKGDDKRDAKIEKAAYAEFAAPFSVQLVTVLQRVFEQIWRTPSYIWAKMALVIVCVSSFQLSHRHASTALYATKFYRAYSSVSHSTTPGRRSRACRISFSPFSQPTRSFPS
jgi:ATP-binding cassette subfamily G (WHITE) protein 2 (PDR)